MKKPLLLRPSRVAAHKLLYSAIVAVLLSGLTFHFILIIVTGLPKNPLSQAGGNLAGRYVDPLFKQTWQLFAPKPLDGNIGVLARAAPSEQGAAWTPWINMNSPVIQEVRSRPFSPLALPRLTLLRAAVSPLTILFFDNQSPAKRKEIFARWTQVPGAKPRELVALERSASTFLLDRFPDADIERIQVRLTLTRFHDYPGTKESDKNVSIRLTLPEVKVHEGVPSIDFP